MFAKLVGHENLVRDVAWHPNDANIVVTVGDDGKVKVYDVRNGGVCKTTFVLESSKSKGTNFHLGNRSIRSQVSSGYFEKGYETNTNS